MFFPHPPPSIPSRRWNNNTVQNKPITITIDQYNSICEKINSLENEVKVLTENMNRLKYQSNITFENHSDGDRLTPEICRLMCTLHIPDISKIIHIERETWGNRGSHVEKIGNALGGLGGTEEVYQLPAKHGKYGVNLKELFT